MNAPVLLTDEMEVQGFSSGSVELDDWLIHQALKNQKKNNCRVYVVTEYESSSVIAYYAIAIGSVSRSSAIKKFSRNSPDPIPVIVLARLAIDQRFQRKGIGTGLLKDCFLRSVGVSQSVGMKGLLVHALDENAKRFYTQFGFVPSPIDSMTLMLSIADIEASLLY